MTFTPWMKVTVDDPPASKLVRHLIPTTKIVASSYGDKKLNFTHNMEKHVSIRRNERN